MSSFNINGPSNNQPIVQGSQNLGKDGGGGGNTGFMNMRNKKKKQEKNEEDNSVFLEETPEDVFEKQGSIPKKKNSGRLIGAISNFIKDKSDKKDIQIQDSFEKNKNTNKNPETDNEFEYQEEDYSSYNVKLNNATDTIEDDEYEVIEGNELLENKSDDDYYNDIDV